MNRTCKNHHREFRRYCRALFNSSEKEFSGRILSNVTEYEEYRETIRKSSAPLDWLFKTERKNKDNPDRNYLATAP